MKKTRWIIVAVSVAVMLAVYLNWKFVNSGGDYILASDTDETYVKTLGGTAYVSNESSYFDNARYSRTKNRSDAVAVLNNLVSNDDADSDTRKIAAETIAKYAELTEKEASVENLIKSKGYGDCVVFLTEDTASVVVETLGLEPFEAAQIMDLVASSTGFDVNVIKIIEFSGVQN